MTALPSSRRDSTNSPSLIPLPPSPTASSRRSNSIRSEVSDLSRRSHSAHARTQTPHSHPTWSSRGTPNQPRALSPLSPKNTSRGRPTIRRNDTNITAKQDYKDPFYEGSTIFINQPVGSLSISPSSRDVCLASRKGLYILDLENLEHAPRFVPQGGAWQIADCQWSPHPATSNLILSTSSQKLLVWDLAANQPLYKSIDAHARAITDINWHARNPNILATISMDTGIRGWDLRNTQRPSFRFAVWNSAGTQVKWNRQHDHLLASSHGKEIYIWDDRKGSVPVVSFKAHDSKIYGIDWDRQHRHKLVSCSLDKTIKFWTVPELRSLADSKVEFYPEISTPDQPTSKISTDYPVWRARNLPFGHGVLSLPQRGEKSLEMYALGDDTPVERFEGHDDVVKEFVWRLRGGNQLDFDDREFQLVTWSKDRTLRVWPVGREMTEKLGYRYGAPIQVLHSRRGALNITYTKVHDADEKKLLPPPIVNPPSGISKQKSTRIEAGMTRGGGHRTKGMDQLDWLSKVVKSNNKASPNSSTMPSRVGSLSRRGSSRSTSAENRTGTAGEWISLKDEVVLVNKLFPRPRINFEKIDLQQRKLTISMNGPWADNDRMAFIRIHWSFPSNYPYGKESDIPTFELEKNPTVSPITRQKLVVTLKEMRADNKQCLVATSGFLLGVHERVGRRLVAEEESDSEDDEAILIRQQAPPLIRTSGATFGPNGQLVCFFPKQTVLPRIKALSRSPSITREQQRNPLIKAMSALSRLENPKNRATVRIKPRIARRFEHSSPTVQPGSTLTIHDTLYLGSPDPELAKLYGSSLDSNIFHAMEAKRLDHAEVWATLKGLVADPPPPYSPHANYSHAGDAWREREEWERGIGRKKELLDQIFETLIQAKDLQMLALVSVVILDYVNSMPIPPIPHSVSIRSPEPDYFALPRTRSFQHVTPTSRQHSLAMIPADAPGGTAGGTSYRTSTTSYSGWSQILNPSSISLRTTPRDRTSFDLPFSKSSLGGGGSYDVEDSPTTQASTSMFFTPAGGISGFSILGGNSTSTSGFGHTRKDSGRIQNRGDRPKHPIMAPIASSPETRNTSNYRTSTSSEHLIGVGTAGGLSSPITTPTGTTPTTNAGSALPTPGINAPGFPTRTGLTPLKSVGTGTGTDRSLASSSHKVSFGSASPLRRNFSKATMDRLPSHQQHLGSKRRVKTCNVKIEIGGEVSEQQSPTLLTPERRAQCEVWKYIYAEYLLRIGLYIKRLELIQHDFLEPGDHGSGATEMARVIAGDPEVAYTSTPFRGIPGIICQRCVSAVDKCPSCNQKPQLGTCSLCRLPIKGLSTGCASCNHKSHLNCFQQHFSLSSTSTSISQGSKATTCAACPCNCLKINGVSAPYITYSISQPSPSGTINRFVAKGSISPVSAVSPRLAGRGVGALGGGGGSSGRLNYASLRDLAARDSSGMIERRDTTSIHHQNQPSLGPGVSALGITGTNTALSGTAGGEEEVERERSVPVVPAIRELSAKEQLQASFAAQQIAGGAGVGGHVGFLARARGLTSEGFLPWGRGHDGQ